MVEEKLQNDLDQINKENLFDLVIMLNIYFKEKKSYVLFEQNLGKLTYEDLKVDYVFLIFFHVQHLDIIDHKNLLLKLILDLYQAVQDQFHLDHVHHKLNFLILTINHVYQLLLMFVFDKFHHEVHS